MATEVATLAVKIDSADAARAADALDKLTDAGNRTEGTAQRVERAWEKAVSRVAAEATRLNGGMDTLNGTQAKMLAAVERVVAQLDRMAATLERVAGDTGAVSGGVGKIADAMDRADKQTAQATNSMGQYGNAVKLSTTATLANANAMDRLLRSAGVATNSVDSLSATAGRTSDGLKRTDDAARKAATGLQETGKGGKQAEDGLNRAGKASQGASREMESLYGVINRLAAVIGVWTMIDTADQWGQIASRLQQATNSTAQFEEAQHRLLEVSNRVYKDYGQTAELFIRSNKSLEQLGYTSSDTLGMVEALSYGLTVSATSADHSASVIDAWSKSVLLGKMELGELQTVIAYAPRLQQALADSLGVSNAELLRMASAGELTTQKLMQVTSQIGVMGAEADNMPTTVRDALTRLNNAFREWIGTANEGIGVTGGMAQALNLVSANLDKVAVAVGLVIAVKLVMWLASVGSAALAAAAALKTAALAATTLHRALGVIGLVSVALRVAGVAFAQTAGAAQDGRRELDLFSGSAEDAVEKLSALSRAQVLRLQVQLDDDIKQKTAEAEEVAQALRSVERDYEALKAAFASGRGVSAAELENVNRALIEQRAKLDDASQALGEAKGRSEQLAAAMRQLESGATTAGQALETTNEAAAKYLEQLRQRALLAGATTDLERLNRLIAAGVLVYADGGEEARAFAGQIDAVGRAGRSAGSALSRLNLSAVETALAKASQGVESSMSALERAYGRGDLAGRTYYQRRIALVQEQAAAQEQAITREIELLQQLNPRGTERQRVAERITAAETKLAGVRAKAADQVADLQEAEAALNRVRGLDSTRYVEEQARAIEAQNLQLQEQIEYFGLTEAQIERLRVARIDEALVQQQAALTSAQARAAGAEEIQEIEDRIAALGRLRAARLAAVGLGETHGSQQTAKAAFDAQVQSWYRGIERINALFVEGFHASLDKNGDAFEAFASNVSKALKTSVASAIYEATIKPVVIRFVAQMAGAVGGAGLQQGILKEVGLLDSGGGGGSGGIGDLFGSGGGLSNAVLNAGDWLHQFDATQSVGRALMDNADAIVDVGGQIIGYGKAIYDLTQGNYGSAVGTAIGTFIMPGIGTAVGSMLGGMLDGVLGGFSGESRSGGLYHYDPDTQQTTRPGWARGDPGPEAMQFANQLLGTTSATIQRAFDAVGSDVLLSRWSAQFESSEKGRGGTSSGGALMIGGEEREFGTFKKGQGYGGKSGSLEEMMKAAEVDTWQTVIQSWQLAIDEFPVLMQNMIRGVDADALGLEAAQALAQQFVGMAEQLNALSVALDALPFGPAVAGTLDYAAALAQAAGGAQQAAALLGSFRSNYYSDAERAAWLAEDLTARFAELGLELPRTREEFRGLVEANLTLGDAGVATVATLLSMESALSSLLPAFDAVTDAVADVVDVGAQLNAAFDTQLQTVRALAGDAQRLLSARNAAGALTDRLARELGRTAGFGLAREAELWASLTTASYEQQIDLASELTDIVMSRHQAEIEAATRMRDLGRSLASYLDNLAVGDLSPHTLGERTTLAEQQVMETIARARAGDEDAMAQVQGQLETALRLWREYGASGADYQAAYQRLTGAAGGLAGWAQSDAEKQLGLAQGSLDALVRLHDIAGGALSALDRQYQQTREELHTQTLALTELGLQTQRLDDIRDLLGGMPAELAALLQPILSTAQMAAVDGWYQDTLGRPADSAGRDYWAGEIGRVGEQPAQDRFKDAAAGNGELVERWYRQYATVAPDQDAINYWAKEAQRYGANAALQRMLDALRANGELIDGSHFNGIANVPWDNYRALLHRDERVLTAAENRAYTAGLTGSGTNDNSAQLLAEMRAMRQELAQLRQQVATSGQQQAQATHQAAGAVVAGVGGAIESTARANEYQRDATHRGAVTA